MSGRYSFIVFLLIALFFGGCSFSIQSAPEPEVGVKSFEEEDNLIFRALEHERKKEYILAKAIFHLLYSKSEKSHYLLEETRMSFLSDNKNETVKLLEKGMSLYPQELGFNRIAIAFYLGQQDFGKAEKEIQKLLKAEKTVKNLILAGNFYLQTKSYNLALKYFESAYKEEQAPEILLNIVDLLYRFLDRKEDAIAHLETYTQMEGCEDIICFKLVEIYGREKNIKGLISTYKKLYKKHENEELARRVIELLMYVKDKKGAIAFLESSKYNKDLLIEIYLADKNFKEAFRVAEKLFYETSNIDYLGRMAIYEYEANKNNLDEKVMKSISKKFEEVVGILEEPIYFNYYGYILIDHDIDAKKGISLVKRALKHEPDSPYYLDSLAWGLYKIGECKEALKVMESFVEKINEDEVLMHYKKIKKCVKEKR
ncbi:MAG: hypothetical protein PHN38_02185 [Sulfurospirillaceae bacterium]|nr:hypothetical protein [Sulfurospirillaceae bacterium]